MLGDFLFAATVGPLHMFGSLAVFALRTARVYAPAYRLVDEAGDSVRVARARGDSAWIAGCPALEITTRADRPVFVAPREPLPGDAAGLALTHSLLVPARGTVVLTAGWTVRAESPRGVVSDLAGQLVEPGQNGAIFAVDGAFVAVEVFDAASTFAAVFPRLLAVYAARAAASLAAVGIVPAPTRAEAESLVGRLGALALSPEETAGEGTALRPTARTQSGRVLCAERGVVHASFSFE